MQESQLYSWDELLFILLFGLISILGVWIIVKKPAQTTK